MWPFHKPKFFEYDKNQHPVTKAQLDAFRELAKRIAQEKTQAIGSCTSCGANSYTFNMDHTRYRCQYCGKLGTTPKG